MSIESGIHKNLWNILLEKVVFHSLSDVAPVNDHMVVPELLLLQDLSWPSNDIVANVRLISIYLMCCSEDIIPPVAQEPAERRVRVRVKLDLRSAQSTSVSVIIIIMNVNLYLASGLRLPLSKDYDSTHNKLW